MPKLPIRYWRYKPLARNADKLAAEMLQTKVPALKLRGLNTICISSTLRPLKWRHEPATGSWHAVRRPWLAIANAVVLCGIGIGVVASAVYQTVWFRMVDQSESFGEAFMGILERFLGGDPLVFGLFLVAAFGTGLCTYAMFYAISSAVFERLQLHPSRGLRIDRRSLRGFSRTEIPTHRIKISFYPLDRSGHHSVSLFIIHRGRPHTPLMVWHNPKEIAKRIERLPDPLKRARFFISDRPLKPRLF